MINLYFAWFDNSLHISDVEQGPTQSETANNARTFCPKKYKKLENSRDSLISGSNENSVDEKLSLSNSSSPLIVLRWGKWQTKNILSFYISKELGNCIIYCCFRAPRLEIFFFRAISNAKIVFIEFPPFLNEFTHFLHFVILNALSNDGRYQKSFQGVFFCQSPLRPPPIVL